MKIRLAVSAVALCVAQAVGAQSPADHVATGDKEYEARNTEAALRHYEAALAADGASYEALWKASRTAVDLGEYDTNVARRTERYKQAEGWARRAVEVNAKDAEGHFHLARAKGRAALTLGKRDRVKYAAEIREHALHALQLDPNHPGALHVMGVWNAEVMRLSGVERFFAKNLLGGKVFGEASWKNAVSYMEKAVASEPDRLVHRLDLAEIYADTDDKAKARETYQMVLRMPARDPNDPQYKQQAEKALARLR